ncbi:MAG: WecB/TagA/CpsF family glycosyltransferase [Solirubrobacteraceae bacterium]|jgi:N-acetylglucosaminyldiphosphoundecaprenol N-acetyl-beta-D-mannosaminyltransferase
MAMPPVQLSASPQPPPRAGLLGIELGLCDYDAACDWIEAMVRTRSPGYMTAAAVHLVMLAQEDAKVLAAVRGATLVVPDGQPVVWALRALGHREISSRVYGPDLMLACCARAAERGTRMYLYGGRSEGALVSLALNLRTRFPGLAIVGASSPPHVGGVPGAPFRELTDDEERRTVEEIDGSGAEIVWVGSGQPHQELWMARMRPELAAPMLIGVGAAFDFHAGLVPQAPPWMGRHGLEWAYRLVREPRRLWRRYLRYNPRFVLAVGRELAARDRRRR